jgi:hypothetical protein
MLKLPFDGGGKGYSQALGTPYRQSFCVSLLKTLRERLPADIKSKTKLLANFNSFNMHKQRKPL